MSPKRTDAESLLASVAAGYLMRWMEGNVYDRAFATEASNALKSLDRPKLYAVEAALNLLAAFFEQRLQGDGALRSVVRRVGADVAPEISKRLLNHAREPSEREAVETLLRLDPEVLRAILDGLYATPAERRADLFAKLAHLPADDLERMAALTPSELATHASSETSQGRSSSRLAEAIRSLRIHLQRRRQERKRGR